ncbi:hypothetical protein LOK49_LG02G02418 [Camellia lanceoleosa]|uniref:Uncharacterized protein n=1 Tax=Camellia lanceoleosa TaxID=1840588 RepID=A0ACC0IMT0_9ERIC|nr:hypothetical protein LOK49_LG02G02418 [Camellia lanceoleosa]
MSDNVGSPAQRVTPEQRHTIEAFEMMRNQMHLEEVDLEKRAEDAISSLGISAQLMLGFISGSVLLQGKFACTVGISVSLMSVVSFVIGFGIAITVAFNKIRRLNRPLQELRRRQSKLYTDIMHFKAENNFVGDRARVQVAVANVDPDSSPQYEYRFVHMDSQFSSRLIDVEDSLSGAQNFLTHYESMVYLMAFGAAIHGITIPLVAYHIFCGTGKGSIDKDTMPKPI